MYRTLARYRPGSAKPHEGVPTMTRMYGVPKLQRRPGDFSYGEHLGGHHWWHLSLGLLF